MRNASSIFLLVHLCHPEKQLASTHIDAVRGLLDVIRAQTKAPIIIGDGSHYGTKAVWRHLGYDQLVEEYKNITFVDLNEDAWTEQTITLADGPMTVRRAKTPQEAGMRIALVPMKTHRVFGTALSILDWTLGTWVVPSRSSARGTVYAREPFLLARSDEEAGKIVAELYRELPCDVAIIDGTVAMEGKGPVEGTLVDMQSALSCTDLFALDAVASTLMSIDPGEVAYLTAGAEAGLGIIDLGRIDVPPAFLTEKTRKFVR